MAQGDRYELYLPNSAPPPAGTAAPPFPLICITPILGRLGFLEDLFLERRQARFFQSHGLASVVIDRPIFEFNPAQGFDQIQRYLEESVRRNRRVLDALVGRKEIDSNRMGSYGMSFGAVINTLWAASDKRLKAHVFSLAGGNIPEIIVTSRDPLMRNYVREMKAAFPNIDLGSALKQSLRTDPLSVAKDIPRGNILMILAFFDHVIRFRYGLALRQALGNPETVFLPLGHYTSIPTIPILKWRVLGFFKKRLS